MRLDVNWCQGGSALRALSVLLMTTVIACTLLLPIGPSQCFNLRIQRFSDYGKLFSITESEKQQQQQQQQQPRPTETNVEPESGISANSSTADFPSSVRTSMVERLLNFESDTDTTASGRERKDNNQQQLIEINLTAVREELLRELNSEAITVRVDADEGIRTVAEQKFREALERVLRRHLELSLNTTAATDHPVTYNHTRSHSTGSSLSSQLICQFFIFGILFGVVCSISTCTCCLQPRTARRRSTQLSGVNPTNVPAPIDYSKPYVMKCDSRGSCYASPLSDDEIPPLPTYNKALTCPTHLSPPPQQSSTT